MWPVGTHYSTVLDAWGPPSKISAIPSGSLFLYQHARTYERQYGLILPGQISRFFKFVYATSQANIDVAALAFDRHGLLMARATHEFVGDPGGGFAFTLIFKFKSLSDTNRFIRTQMGLLEWGMALTHSLPVALNAAQSLDSGANGMDVIPIDGLMGQQTLELTPPQNRIRR